MWPVDHEPLSNHPAFRNKFQKLATAQRARGSYSTLFEHKSSQEFQSDTIFLGVTPQYGLLHIVWVTVSKYSSWGQCFQSHLESHHEGHSVGCLSWGSLCSSWSQFLKVPTAGVAKNVQRSRNCNQNKRKKELLKPFYVTVREIVLSSWIFLNS